MTTKKIEITKDKITCEIIIPEYSNRSNKRRIYLDDKRVKLLLIEQELNPGKVIESSRVDNFSEILTGTWIFENADYQSEIIIEVEEIPTNTTKNNNNRSRKKKIQKVLDNSPKDVIIEE